MSQTLNLLLLLMSRAAHVQKDIEKKYTQKEVTHSEKNRHSEKLCSFLYAHDKTNRGAPDVRALHWQVRQHALLGLNTSLAQYTIRQT